MSTYIINKDVLDRLVQLSHYFEEELCCFLINYNNYIFIDENSCNLGQKIAYEQKGTSEVKYRGSCTHKVVSTQSKFPDFILHTHPITSKPYPSYEDIRTVFKMKDLKASIIATRDGLWILSITRNDVKDYIRRNHTVNNHFNYDSFDDEYKNGIEYYLTKIYYIFTEDRSKPLLIQNIYEIIDKINSKYGIHLQYYNWADILRKELKFYL